MIAPKDQRLCVKPDLMGNFKNKLSEICGRHTCVPAVLVDLVTRGFDQNEALFLCAMHQRRFDHNRMR